MELVWNVFRHDINKSEIEVFNIFDHWKFAKETEENLKKYKEKERFATALKTDLIYYFWSKSEYEVVITSWTPYIDMKELDRLNDERTEYREKYFKEPFHLDVRLNVRSKIDIYEQVMNNWDIFLDYVWNSKIHRPRKQYASWEYDPNGMDWGIGAWRCSKCGCVNDNLYSSNNINPYQMAGSKFCPNCGLPMKG